GLAMYVTRAMNELEKINTASATLLWHLTKHTVSGVKLEAWYITQREGERHQCQCNICKSRISRESKQNIDLIGLLKNLKRPRKSWQMQEGFLKEIKIGQMPIQPTMRKRKGRRRHWRYWRTNGRGG